jgi:hypothetical protein
VFRYLQGTKGREKASRLIWFMCVALSILTQRNKISSLIRLVGTKFGLTKRELFASFVKGSGIVSQSTTGHSQCLLTRCP